MIGSFVYNNDLKNQYEKFLEKNRLYAKVANNTFLLTKRLQRMHFEYQRRSDLLENCLSGISAASAIFGGFMRRSQCQAIAVKGSVDLIQASSKVKQVNQVAQIINDGKNLIQAADKLEKITQITAGSFSQLVKQNSTKIGTAVAVITFGITEIVGFCSKRKEFDKLKEAVIMLDEEIQKHVQLFKNFCSNIDQLKSWQVTKQNLLEKQNLVLINWKG